MLKTRLDIVTVEHPFFNLNEAVYETLCRSIIDLTLAPGESLSETALAKELNVSRSPVRNALLRLQSEGLVTQSKGHSFQVAAIRKEDCRELMDAKALAPKATERKVAYVPGAPFYPNGGHGNHLRLNFSTMQEDRIVEGIRILGQLLQEETEA